MYIHYIHTLKTITISATIIHLVGNARCTHMLTVCNTVLINQLTAPQYT